MKRSIAVLLAVLFIAASVGTAFAEEKKEGEGFEIEAGLKVWYNKWKSEDPADPVLGTTNFDYSLLVGPAVEMKFPHHFYAEASYLISTNDYEATMGLLKMTADRKDLDLAVGYRIIPQIGVFAGYKDVQQDWNQMGLTSGSLELKGPMFGVRGDVPVNETFGVYASYTYLKTKLESSEVGFPTTNNNAPGSIIELGVKMAFAKELSGTLGYKVEQTKEKNTNIKDTFSGVTLGVMYAF